VLHSVIHQLALLVVLLLIAILVLSLLVFGVQNRTFAMTLAQIQLMVVVNIFFCSAIEEEPVTISACITDGPLPWTVNWTGGWNDGNGTVGGVYIYIVDSIGNVWSQFGVPTSISSKQTTINWLPNGISNGTFSILLESSTDNNNFDYCNITVGSLNGSTTVVASWSPCDQACGGGYQKRNVACFNNGVLTTGSPCTGDAPITYQNCNVFPCVAGSLIIESPKHGAVFQPNSTITISWTGGSLGKLLSLDLLQSLPNILPTIQVFTDINIAYVYNTAPFQWTGTLSPNLPSGDYLLSLSVITPNLETTDVSDETPIHISGIGDYVFTIVVRDLNPVTVTLYGNIDSQQYTLNPNSTTDSISVQTRNIGYVYKAFTASNNLVAMTVSTNQASKSIFGMVSGSNSSDCSLPTSCDACLIISTCAWCDSSQLCLPTGSTGPSIGVCKARWLATPQACHSFFSTTSSGPTIAIHCMALLGMILLQLIF